MSQRHIVVCSFLMATLPALMAAQTPGAGHWAGSIQAPNGPIEAQVDLVRADGAWSGAISVPSRKLNNVPLVEVSVADRVVSFALKLGDVKPVFRAKLNEDSSEMAGELELPDEKFSFNFKRTGEVTAKLPARSGPIAKALEGDWQGSIEAEGNVVQVKITLRRDGENSSSGSLESAGAGRDIKGLPINSIRQEGDAFSFEVAMVGGAYAGKLNAGQSEIAGSWTQHGYTLPLVLKRVAK